MWYKGMLFTDGDGDGDVDGDGDWASDFIKLTAIASIKDSDVNFIPIHRQEHLQLGTQNFLLILRKYTSYLDKILDQKDYSNN